jgi:hypothetical protein
LTDAQRFAVHAEAASLTWRIFTRDQYRSALEREMNETRPRVVAPDSDTPTNDVVRAWLQPEGRQLWQRIIAAQAATRSTVGSLHFALGVMLALAAMRATPHVRHAYDLLLNNAALFRLVTELALSCEGVLGCEPRPISYEQVTRYLPRLSEGLAGEAQIALAQIGHSISTWGIPVGRYLAVDGSLVPAWAQQRAASVNGKWDPALEAHLRRRAPEAGFVAYSGYGDDGLDEQAQAREGANKARRGAPRVFVRGYRLNCLVDISTGLPLVFDLADATNSHEPRILRDVLLPTLFDLSPDLDVNAIVADAGYDDNTTHEHLERYYGIHLVVNRKAHALKKRGIFLKEHQHASVAGVGGDGQAVCRSHGVALPYAGLDAPSRNGLVPGEPTNAARFRSRFICANGCGKVSVPTQACWSNLPHYPHTPHGRLQLFARRLVLLGRREIIESAYSSLQVGYKQGLDGPVRVRVYDRGANEGFISISLVTRGLLTLLAERTRRGEYD